MSLLDAAGSVTGDIWCSGVFSFDSPLKDLLDSGEYTLEQLLAEDELLQEIRGSHPQLLEFFSTEEAVAGLVRYVILPPLREQMHQEGPCTAAAAGIVSSSSRPAHFNQQQQVGDDVEQETQGQEEENGNHEQANAMAVEETTQSDGCADIPAISSMQLGTSPESRKVQEDQATGSNYATDDDSNDKNATNDEEEEQDYALEQRPGKMTEQEERDVMHIRFPYMACEVICCEIKSIIDILVDGIVPENDGDGNEQEGNARSEQRPRLILDLLFSMLYDAGPGEIDDYRAGYFDKILSILFRKRPKALSRYINDGGGKGKITLMSALFRHLYSHSIMQIIQRLLLPQPSYPSQLDDDGQDNGEDGQQDEYDDPQQVLEGEFDGDTDGFGGFRCDWTETPESLEMLLDCLIGNKSPVGIEDDEELQLNLYQNASEVLITIIQNSPLTSPTLCALTSDPILQRLIIAATRLDDGTKFSPHDSRLTCAMNVLESLILQLGGYGSVGMMYGDEENEEGIDPSAMLEEALGREGGQGDTQPDTPHPAANADGSEVPLSPGPSEHGPQQEYGEEANQDYATADTLILHLPYMLASLSGLLLDKNANSWLSEMQFATEPQKILGSSRLRIVRLLESLVLLGDPVVDAHLVESDSLEICLDLFWEFQWCSMLHQSVANLLVHIFEGQNTRAELQSYFVVKCNLLGRLMNSFWDSTETAGLTEDIMALRNSHNPPPSSIASEKGSSTDEVLPVSDDDVDAAMEQQETIAKQTENLRRADHALAQSFRLGYMGHVIIICQALVHACASDGKSEAQSVSGFGVSGSASDLNGGELETFDEKINGDGTNPTVQQENQASSHVLDRDRAGESVTTDDTMGTASLIITQLVDSHPLSNEWQQFVATTLATETAIQSGPLGGYQGQTPGMDPLQLHRPGSDEDEYDGYDDGAQPLPARGLMVGGDAIDMDDNDLDIAATMMAGMSLGRPAGGDNPTAQDLLASIPNQPLRGSSGMGYIFDDPLGGGKFYDDDDNDNVKDNDDGSSDSSSDEESEQSGNTGDSGSAVVDGVSQTFSSTDNDAPVMDLFAGNLDPFVDGEQQNPSTTTSASNADANWSDFANFDDAFADSTPTGGEAEGNPADSNYDTISKSFDNVFGDAKDHAMLLEELDKTPSLQHTKEPNMTDEEALNSIPRE